MSLIEQLGGYEKARPYLILSDSHVGYTHVYLHGNGLYCFLDENVDYIIPDRAINIKEARKALLQYRRENNIFEIGDKVKHDMSAPGEIFTIMDFNGFDFLLNDGDWIFIDYLEHCTDAEIAQGFRDE